MMLPLYEKEWDPIIAELRRYRAEHAKKNGNVLIAFIRHCAKPRQNQIVKSCIENRGYCSPKLAANKELNTKAIAENKSINQRVSEILKQSVNE